MKQKDGTQYYKANRKQSFEVLVQAVSRRKELNLQRWIKESLGVLRACGQETVPATRQPAPWLRTTPTVCMFAFSYSREWGRELLDHLGPCSAAQWHLWHPLSPSDACTDPTSSSAHLDFLSTCSVPGAAQSAFHTNLTAVPQGKEHLPPDEHPPSHHLSSPLSLYSPTSEPEQHRLSQAHSQVELRSIPCPSNSLRGLGQLSGCDTQRAHLGTMQGKRQLIATSCTTAGI